MKPDLEPCKKILRFFLSEIAEVNKIQQSISVPILTPMSIKDRTPDLSGIEFVPAQDTFWTQENAYMWIYAEAWRFREFMHPPKNNQIPEYYLQLALPLYLQWRDEEKEVTYRGSIIPSPEDITLIDYLYQLQSCIQEENIGVRLGINIGVSIGVKYWGQAWAVKNFTNTPDIHVSRSLPI